MKECKTDRGRCWLRDGERVRESEIERATSHAVLSNTYTRTRHRGSFTVIFANIFSMWMCILCCTCMCVRSQIQKFNSPHVQLCHADCRCNSNAVERQQTDQSAVRKHGNQNWHVNTIHGGKFKQKTFWRLFSPSKSLNLILFIILKITGNIVLFNNDCYMFEEPP